MSLLYHAYVYLEFLILACTIYILAPSYDKMKKKPVLKTSICTGEQVAGFQDIHTGKIEEIMLIKQTGDIDTFKQMYGIDGEIPKVY